MGLQERLRAQLQQREREQLHRQRLSLDSPQAAEIRLGNEQLLNFCSNDYLGLANHPAVIEASQAAAAQWGAGSGASHLVCGHTSLVDELERKFANFVGAQRALLLSTGYMANLAAITSFAGRGSWVLQDKLNHASLIDAATLSRARLKRWRHGDTAHLRQLLQQPDRPESLLLASDSVFSMDGDLANLGELANIGHEYDALTLLDDAHGIGVMGRDGRGSLDAAGLQPKGNLLMLATLGKALGNFGALLTGDDLLIETLVQQARPYIYTTALPPSVVAGSLKALELLQSEAWRQQQLQENIRYFCQCAGQENLPLMASRTAIQPIVLGSNQRALDASRALREKGLLVTAIRPPTVPKSTARLRITLRADHSRQQIDRLLENLVQLSVQPELAQ